VAYDNLAHEFEALAALPHDRNAAGLTQAKVGARMESSIGK
jgi:hypothetical protein